MNTIQNKIDDYLSQTKKSEVLFETKTTFRKQARTKLNAFIENIDFANFYNDMRDISASSNSKHSTHETMRKATPKADKLLQDIFKSIKTIGMKYIKDNVTDF